MSFGGKPYGKRQDVIEVPRLEPKDLYERRKRRDFARLRAYNTLLEQIYHRVYASSQLPGNTSSILYTVPPFILGLPKLDMEDCIVYIVFQLRQSEFEVKFTWPNLLAISWKHHEHKYLIEQNPIMQAMTPDAPPPPQQKGGSQKKKSLHPKEVWKAGKPSVSYNDDIDYITGSVSSSLQNSSQGSQFGLPPLPPLPQMSQMSQMHSMGPGSSQGQLTQRRSAAEYQPPPSFIQSMDRPQVQRSGVTPLLRSEDFGPGRSLPRQQKPAEGNVLADLWTV